MVLTDCLRWSLSMLQEATTWTSLSFMNSSVLFGPCMPQPTTPKVMRSEGAGRPSRPKAEAGMKVGNAMAAPAALVTLRKLRRLRRAGEGMPFVIVRHHGPQPDHKTREKNNFFEGGRNGDFF